MAGPINVAVGVEGYAAVQGSALNARIQQMQDELRKFPDKIMRRYGLRAIKKASHWGKLALEVQVSRLGKKTGNLSRAVASKAKVYTRNKQNVLVPVAIVGFRRSGTGDSRKVPGGKLQIGNDRAFHSHLVEFGTKRRLPGKSKKIRSARVSVNGRRQTLVLRKKEAVDRNRWHVMSSYNTSGPFKVTRSGTAPAYPFAFIAKVDAERGLGQMPAFHPVQKAFRSSKDTMERVLETQFEQGLKLAAIDYAKGKY